MPSGGQTALTIGSQRADCATLPANAASLTHSASLSPLSDDTTGEPIIRTEERQRSESVDFLEFDGNRPRCSSLANR